MKKLMHSRRLTTILLSLAALALLAPASAAAATKPGPTITFVSPMRAQVGATLTIRGKRFSPRRTRNTVIFRAPSGRTAFVKPKRATRTKLVVTIPAVIERLLNRSGGNALPTRFKLRVLAGRFGRFTPPRLSPVILSIRSSGGGGGGGGGAFGIPPQGFCGTGDDYDGDLLSNSMEAVDLKTDPCLSDTDGDGVEDGYEYQSAIELNDYPASAPVPYPGKRPYPNALDPSDGSVDYDGDGLLMRDEFQLWLRYSADGVGRPGHPTSLEPLLYSDGLQRSLNPPPAAPGDARTNWALDWDEDGVLSDDERDADGDGLGNWDELRGRMTEPWWPAQHGGNPEPKESKYPGINFLDNDDLPNHDAHTDPDVDGDGVLDGADDYDHDGLSNQFEVRRPDDWQTDSWTVVGGVFSPGPNSWAYTNPFNPCKPYNSDRCHRVFPIGYYNSDEVPPVGPNPPGGYPDSAPATPDG
jgi:hypothetical protein